MTGQILAKLAGGPLDAQILPLEIEDHEAAEDELVLPWEQGHLLYRLAGPAENTGPHDGPTTIPYRYESEI